jgi:hypothetical protein
MFQLGKKFLIKLVVVFILILCFDHVSGQKIGIAIENDSIQKLFFCNDTMIVKFSEVVFSPDSQLCGIVRPIQKSFSVYDNCHILKREGRIAPGMLRISNDGKIVILSYHWTENLITTIDAYFYDKDFKEIKDTIFVDRTDASFADDNTLILVHPNNLIGDRGSKSKKDTWILLFDSNFNLKFTKLICFPSKTVYPVHFSNETGEYVLKMVDWQNQDCGYLTIKPE